MNSNSTSVTPGRTAILVLGMHRSGTSATTRVLNLLGAELGANLLEAQADNAKGFWEQADVVQIHEELLAALGRTWHDVREMPEDWLEQPASYAAIDKLVKVISRDFADTALWAMKDPRMCRLVPLWRETLKRAGVGARALIVMRPPDEVAGSLAAREGWSEQHSDLMWTQYTLEAIRHTQDMPRSIMSYDELMADWRAVMRRVSEQLEVQWPNTDEEHARQIDEFVTPEDRHHRSTDAAKPAKPSPLAPRSLPRQIYALGVDVAAGRASWAELAQVDQRYIETAVLFREVVQQKYEIDSLAARQHTHIQELERELQAASSLATERGNHIQLLATQHHGVMQASAELHERIAHLEGMVAERDIALTAARSLATELAEQCELESKSNEALSRRCLELDNELREEQAQEANANADLEKLRHRCDELSQALALTFSRRWLVRRLWEVISKGSAAGKPVA